MRPSRRSHDGFSAHSRVISDYATGESSTAAEEMRAGDERRLVGVRLGLRKREWDEKKKRRKEMLEEEEARRRVGAIQESLTGRYFHFS
jgi:hypothetical protein